MGKLTHSPQIQHSSHPHLLHLSSSFHLQNQPSINCAGCNLHVSAGEHIYTCRPCSFFLHLSCTKFPELITHPSHHEHALTLLPTCIYPGGFFRCDACGQQGNRFSYHCHICDFDLHVLCSSKPLSVTHPFHPHPLLLTFSSPYDEKLGFSCDVCRNVGSSNQWLYRCVSCQFDVHLQCAAAKPPPQPPLLHHHRSIPGTAPIAHPNQFIGPVVAQSLPHSMSSGHVHSQWQPPQIPAPGGPQSYQRPAQPPVPVDVQNYQQLPQPSTPVAATPDVVPHNVLAEEMMIQLGQDFAQILTGGDGGGGGDGSNDDFQSIIVYENYEN